MSDFANCTWPVGRKDHRCEWCGQMIPKGEKHFHYAGVWEGEWQNWRMHQECYDAYQKEDFYYGDGFTPFDNERPKPESAGIRGCDPGRAAVQTTGDNATGCGGNQASNN